MNKFKMAMRSIAYRKKQYIPLLIVSAFGIAISVFCVFVVKGMLTALEGKGKIYYGGDFMIWSGKFAEYDLSTPDVYNIIEEMRPSFPAGSVLTARFDFNASKDSSFYFEGVSAMQRVIKGVDFEIEKNLLRQFTFTEGGIENAAGTNAILLSLPIATRLNVKCGDEITLFTKTVDGFVNTVPLAVRGIFQDSSLFGAYTSYADINFLRKVCGVPNDWANRICITLPPKIDADKIALEIQASLEKKFQMFPLEKDKYEFRYYKEKAQGTGLLHKLVPLSENFADVEILIDAMKAVTFFVILILLVIIAVGVGSAFRVMVMKRVNEIGIYMAIGMKRAEITILILCETFVLMIAGSIFGFGLSLVFCKVLSAFDLSFIPAFDIFLIDGSIAPQISFVVFLAMSLAVCVTTISAVLFSIRKSMSATPVEALGVTE